MTTKQNVEEVEFDRSEFFTIHQNSKQNFLELPRDFHLGLWKLENFPNLTMEWSLARECGEASLARCFKETAYLLIFYNQNSVAKFY
jgi:hypothetical protein